MTTIDRADRTGAPARGARPTRRPGERRIVTVLFCDVVDSTAMAEQLDPEDWAEIMEDAFAALSEPVKRYEGTVVRLMGDAILAIFGAPVAHEEDPQRAVLAGLEMTQSLAPLAERVRADHQFDFRVRVGINTGPVMVGQVGTDAAVEYTAMGDAVNVAARMEQTAPPGTVQISAETHRFVAPYFEFESLGDIEVKGKKAPISAFRVLGRREHADRSLAAKIIESPLVGRAPELAKLRKLLDDLREGRGQIVCLIAEPGLGKSRLVQELRESWNDREGSWREARGVSFEMARPYGLFRGLLSDRFGIGESDPPNVIQEKVRGDGGLPETDPDRIVRVVEALLGSGSSSDDTALEGEELKQETYEAMSLLWRQSAQAGPTVIVFEDLHWADPASIELLGRLLSLSEELPLAFICTTRPDRQSPGWSLKQIAETEHPHHYTEIWLEPLADEESNELAGALAGGPNLPPQLLRLILRKTEGNPLFLEEIILSLIEGDYLVRDTEGRLVQGAADIDEIALPESLQAILLARIDRLEPEARRVLQLASVIGRQFARQILSETLAGDGSLDGHLRNLERVDLIREASRIPEFRYIFKHELVKDAAYGSILRRSRAEFHRRVAEAIETLHADGLEGDADRLAYHYAQAGEDERALKYQAIAGDSAVRLYANAEAITHYTKAIETIPSVADPGPGLSQAILLHKRGQVHERIGAFEPARSDFEASRTLASEAHDLNGEWQALTALGRLWAGRDYQQTGTYYSRALEIARTLDDPTVLGQSLNYFGNWQVNTGRPDEGIESHQEARAIVEKIGEKYGIAQTLDYLSMAQFHAGDLIASKSTSDDALQLFRELGDLVALTTALTSRAGHQGGFMTWVVSTMVADKDDVEKDLDEGLVLARQSGRLPEEAFAQWVASGISSDGGDFSDALDHADSAIEIATEIGHKQWLAAALVTRARIFLLMGLYDLALAEAEKALPLAQGLGSFFWEAHTASTRALSLVGEKRLEDARAVLSEIMKSSQQPRNMAERQLSHAWAELAFAEGNPEEALAIATRLRDTAPGLISSESIPTVEHLRGLALLELDRLDESVASLESAKQGAIDRGLQPLVWKIELSLAHTHRKAARSAEADAELASANQVVGGLAATITDTSLRQRFLTAALQQLAS